MVAVTVMLEFESNVHLKLCLSQTDTVNFSSALKALRKKKDLKVKFGKTERNQLQLQRPTRRRLSDPRRKTTVKQKDQGEKL